MAGETTYPGVNEPVRPEDITEFQKEEWSRALLSHPDASFPVSPNRRPPPPLYEYCNNSMFSETLWTDRTIRSAYIVTLPMPENRYFPVEMNMMYSLGQGLDGMTGRAHGGLVSLIIDQCMGIWATQAHKADATVNLNIDFKAPVSTPCLALCRVHIAAIKGRKCIVKGVLEDGKGKVFAEGKGVFVQSKMSVKALPPLSSKRGVGEADKAKAKL